MDGARWAQLVVRDPTVPDDLQAFAACRIVGRRIRWMGWQGVRLAFVEKPFGRALTGLVPVVRVQGAVVAALPDQMEVWETTPQEWKKEAVGNGNAKKDDVVAWCNDVGFVPDGRTQDACDAFGIAYAMREKNRRAIAAAGNGDGGGDG